MRIFLIGMFLFCSISSFGQIIEVEKPKFEKIGEVKPGGVAFICSMQVSRGSTKDDTNTYLWTYNNSRYRTIDVFNSISFTANENDFNSFYEMLKSQITSPKGTEKQIVLGKNNVLIETIRNLGVSSLTIHDLTQDGYFYLTSGQIDKLFGKK
jgi:hypothetical protein